MSLKMRMTLLGSLTLLLTMARPIDLSGANGNFVPDWTFKGSALTEWQQIGQTDWRAENGEIVGTPRTPEGGWLVLNQSFQDVQVAASFRCAGACKPGVLIRAEKTPDGMKGILVSYAPDDTAAYAITLDPQGKEISREKIRAGGGQARFVANADGTQPNAPPGRGGPPAAATAAPGGRAGAAPPVPGPAAGGPAGGRAGAGAPGWRRPWRPRSRDDARGLHEPVHDADVRFQTDGLEHARGGNRRQHSARLAERRP